jgi:hypothetical protein
MTDAMKGFLFFGGLIGAASAAFFAVGGLASVTLFLGLCLLVALVALAGERW